MVSRVADKLSVASSIDLLVFLVFSVLALILERFLLISLSFILKDFFLAIY